MSKDEELLLEAFQMLYQVYREQKAGRVLPAYVYLPYSGKDTASAG
jgi:hypothetical protein